MFTNSSSTDCIKFNSLWLYVQLHDHVCLCVIQVPNGIVSLQQSSSNPNLVGYEGRARPVSLPDPLPYSQTDGKPNELTAREEFLNRSKSSRYTSLVGLYQVFVVEPFSFSTARTTVLNIIESIKRLYITTTCDSVDRLIRVRVAWLFTRILVSQYCSRSVNLPVVSPKLECYSLQELILALVDTVFLNLQCSL